METTQIEMKKRSPTSINTTLDILEDTALGHKEGKMKKKKRTT